MGKSFRTAIFRFWTVSKLYKYLQSIIPGFVNFYIANLLVIF